MIAVTPKGVDDGFAVREVILVHRLSGEAFPPTPEAMGESYASAARLVPGVRGKQGIEDMASKED